MLSDRWTLTFDVREGTEEAARAVAGLLHVVTLGGLVNLGMELLLGARMTVAAAIARLTVAGLAPLLAVLHVWTRRTAIFIFPRRSTFILQGNYIFLDINTFTCVDTHFI